MSKVTINHYAAPSNGALPKPIAPAERPSVAHHSSALDASKLRENLAAIKNGNVPPASGEPGHVFNTTGLGGGAGAPKFTTGGPQTQNLRGEIDYSNPAKK